VDAETKSKVKSHVATGTIAAILATAAPMILGYIELEKAKLEAQANAQKAAEVAVGTTEDDVEKMHAAVQAFNNEFSVWVEKRIEESEARTQRSLHTVAELDKDMAVVKYILRTRMDRAQKNVPKPVAAAEGEREGSDTDADAIPDKPEPEPAPRLKSFDAVQALRVPTKTRRPADARKLPQIKF